jgi:ATP-binding cassette subfamily B protein
VRGALHTLTDAARLVWSASRRLLLIRLALAAAAGAVPIGIAWSTKVVLDGIAPSTRGPAWTALRSVLVLALLGVLGVVLPRLVSYVDRQLMRVVGLEVRSRLYAAVAGMKGLTRLENPQFNDRLRLATDLGPTGPSQLVGSCLSVVQSGLTIGGFIGALLYLNPWMVLVVALAAVPTLRAEIGLARRRAGTMWELSAANRRELFYADLLTSLTAAKELRLFGLGNLFGTRMLTELRRINDGNRRMDLRELASQGLLAILGAVVAGAGLVWAVLAARAGALTVGDVAIFVAAVNGVQAGLSAAISSIARAHESTLTFDHVRYVVRAAAEPPSPTQPYRSAATSRLAPLRHGIELRDVWFRYRDGLPWVLRGVDLFLPAGRSTALVGLNGAGKSTLVKLLCGLYEPTRGTIRWDGSDLRQLPVDEVRRRIGAVFQDFMEYELTAAESIGLGDLARWGDRHQIEAAARRAGCHDMVTALPSGYDTLLTRIYTDLADRNDPGTGVVLSGGQSQRIALARALLRQDCDLLILDEPSAGLDAAAEYEVHRRLRDHSRDKTSLLISHRLSAVRDADTIVVLREGTVVEQGSHDQLLAAGGPYAELFTLQAAGYRTEPSDLTGVA